MKTFTTGEAAKICNVNFRTIGRWIERGYLEGYSLPGRGDKRITEDALRSFLVKNNMPIPKELELPNKVLVVDDDVKMAKAISRFLKRRKYDVQVADSGFAAGVLLEEFQPNLMTLDLRMPGMDGFEVLSFIQKRDTNRCPKILVISAESTPILNKALDSGADAFLQKPFKNEELLSHVETLLGLQGDS